VQGKTYIAAAAILVSLVFAGSAQAFVLPLPHEPSYYREHCPSYPDDMNVVGCAYIFGKDREEWADMYADVGSGPFVYHHERAHWFDALVMTDAHRAKFSALLGLSGSWWDGSPPVGELFADAAATCSMQANGRPRYAIAYWDHRGRPLGIEAPGYGYTVSWQTHRRICQLIWHAAGLTWAQPVPLLATRAARHRMRRPPTPDPAPRRKS
jgi:hypothetical protein